MAFPTELALTAEQQARLDVVRLRDRSTQVPRHSSSSAELSAREVEVLQLIADGLTNDEIAAQLYLGVETIKTHAKHIKQRLGGRNRVHVVALALRRGLVT